MENIHIWELVCKMLNLWRIFNRNKTSLCKKIFFPKHAVRRDRDCFVDENNISQLLDTNCSYYAQIQGQLAICRLRLCKLVVYTLKGINVIDVNYSHNFWIASEAKLVSFFEMHLAPAILTQSTSAPKDVEQIEQNMNI